MLHEMSSTAQIAVLDFPFCMFLPAYPARCSDTKLHQKNNVILGEDNASESSVLSTPFLA